MFLQQHLILRLQQAGVPIHERGFCRCSLSINTFVADEGIISGKKYGFYLQWDVQEVVFQLREGAAKPMRRTIGVVWTCGSMGTTYRDSASGVIQRAAEKLADQFSTAFNHNNPATK